uniref:hypothetical protein n=1 Tax=Bacteroides xylanisolvens TaxID=371601 RepID=UPI0035694F50
MVNATNVSQKECNTPIKRGGKALSEEEVNECMANGGMILSSGEMTMPLSESESILHVFRPRNKNKEEQYVNLIKKIRNGEQCSSSEYLFLIKEGNINLRVIYGVYLSLCQKNGVAKVITWRTFYMQCSGYRTLKPNTMAAISEYIQMKVGK